MTQLFSVVLNMSIIASYVAVFVGAVRLLLKKVPKVFSYALWAIVFFRMICPFSFENILSILPKNANNISQNIIYPQRATINSGNVILEDAVKGIPQNIVPPESIENSVNPRVTFLEIGAYIWSLGIIILLAYSLLAYLKLKSRLSTATLIEENIFESDRITSPFVMGFIKPKIYLPVGLSGVDKHYILLHESVHIKRLDYLVKPFAFLAIALHWFNPFMWLSYKLMCKDMEMSCDEKVLKMMGEDIKIGYSNTLLSFSEKQSGLLSPLAFGEHNAKSRIKNVLHYKRPSFWVLLVVIVTVIVVGIGLISNPKESKKEAVTEKNDISESNNRSEAQDALPSFIVDPVSQLPDELIVDEILLTASKKFPEITKIEIKYNYFNHFESNYRPYVIEDKTLIDTITGMMDKAVIATNAQVEEVDRTNNPHATITLYKEGIKTEVPYIIDDLYNKSVFEYEGSHYLAHYDLARLVANLETFRPKNGNVEKPVQDLLRHYNWDSSFLISTTEVKLPDNLLQKAGEFPTKLYWKHNLQLSKDVGLDFSSSLGKNVTAELYYLINSLPEAFYPQQDATAVILKQNGNIIGAYINAGRHSGFACSLKRNSFEAVAHETFGNQMVANGYDMTDGINIKNAKLTPEELVTQYIEALNRNDNSHYQYISTQDLASNLFRNMDNTKLYNSEWENGNIKSMKLLKMKQSDAYSSDSQIQFNIELDIKVKKVITMDSGITSYGIMLVKEGNMGWKVDGMGH